MKNCFIFILKEITVHMMIWQKKKNDFQIVIIEIFKMIKICLRQTLHGSSMTVLFKESQTKGNKSFITLETYSEPCQTFKTKFFAKISNCLQLNPFQFR